MSTYTELVPGFTALLSRERGELGRFYAAVKAIARLERPERRLRLGAAPGEETSD